MEYHQRQSQHYTFVDSSGRRRDQPPSSPTKIITATGLVYAKLQRARDRAAVRPTATARRRRSDDAATMTTARRQRRRRDDSGDVLTETLELAGVLVP